MKSRILTALVGIPIIIAFIWFSHTPALLVFTGFLTAASLLELARCAGLEKKLYAILPLEAAALSTILMTRLASSHERFFVFTFMIFFILLLYLASAAVFSRGHLKITESAYLHFTGLYVTFGFASMVLVRDRPYGQYAFVLCMLVPWISDSFAYFGGRLFGKHKLIPDISPKKTVEGAVCGVVFGTLSIVLYGFVIGLIFDAQPNYSALIAVGAAMTVISQCGDLIASCIKRHFGVKDYGRILPGHGGIMDRFDSIIVTSPIVYMLCTLSPVFEIFIDRV